MFAPKTSELCTLTALSGINTLPSHVPVILPPPVILTSGYGVVVGGVYPVAVD